jgi:exodeoxyribonuclease VII small subunit
VAPVSISPKQANESEAGKQVLPFETALQNLEKIVEAMEGGELPLEQLLVQFEEGTRLVKVCQTKLEEAELKIQRLEKNASGEVVLKPMKVTQVENEL